MDPWLSKSDQVEKTGCKESVAADLENSFSTSDSKDGSSIPVSFSDNFQPFQKLPDSDQYLASLERKLSNIQTTGQKTSGDLLKSLEETRESYMVNLLSDSVEIGSCGEESFEELKINPVLKKLVPEKQAITTEELVHLLKADQLDSLVNSQEEPTESAQSPPPPSTSPVEPTDNVNPTLNQDSSL